MFHWKFLISYIFPVSLKFETYYITGRVHSKDKSATLYLYTCTFLAFVFVFHHLHFYYFHFFFDEVSHFCNRILTAKKLEMCNKKLSVYLCEWAISEKIHTGGRFRTWSLQGCWKNKMWKFQELRIGIYNSDQEKIMWNFFESWI